MVEVAKKPLLRIVLPQMYQLMQQLPNFGQVGESTLGLLI
jgi:hypothetical protein